MIDPFFNLSHRFPCLDSRRTGHAANRLPGRLRGVAQVRIGGGECLAFHVLIVADQISIPQQTGRSKNRRYGNRRIGEWLDFVPVVHTRNVAGADVSAATTGHRIGRDGATTGGAAKCSESRGYGRVVASATSALAGKRR